MKYERILTFTDIHGCADTLKSLVERVDPTINDVLIFLGDYVDRGDKSYEVVDYLIELDKIFDCVFLKGNHEDMFVNYLKHKLRMDDYNMFLYNGGNATLKSYCDNTIDEETGNPLDSKTGLSFEDLPKSHQEFYDNLKIYHEIDDFIFVHAGLNPAHSLENQNEHDMLWIREPFLNYRGTVLEGKTIVHGHTPMEQDELDKYHDKYSDRINLDSACVFGYELTCMDVLTRKETKTKLIDKRIG